PVWSLRKTRRIGRRRMTATALRPSGCAPSSPCRERARALSWRARRISSGLVGVNETADEGAVDLFGERVDIEALPGEKRPRVFDAVDTCRLDIDVREPRAGELGDVLIVSERPGDAADPELHAPANRGGHLSANDHVGDREASTRLEHAEGFPQHAVLVARKIDDAVREDDVDRVVRERDVYDFPVAELD